MLIFPDRRATRNSIESSCNNFLGKHPPLSYLTLGQTICVTEFPATFMTLHSNFVNAMVINEVIFREKI